MRRRAASWAAAAIIAALGVAGACGDVPTLPHGVAYITPIRLPSPSVAYGDTLRDSLGRAAPLRVYAIGRDSADTIRDVTLRFLLTSLATGATIDTNGFLRAPDTLATLRLVAQVTDGSSLRLQTPEITIDVVPRADSIAQGNAAGDTLQALPVVRPLAVTVTGVGPKGRGTVSGIRVRYRIAAVFPSSVPTASRYYLSDDAGGVLRPDSTIAIDTTSSSGVASRTFVGLLAPGGEANADSVLVEASGPEWMKLKGSPVRFMVRIRK